MQNDFRLGIIGAMQSEVDGIVAAMTDTASEVIGGRTFVSGKLCGKEVVVTGSGVGKVFAAMAAEILLLRFGVSALLNTGVAGGLEPSLTVGDVVVADAVVQHDMNTTALGDPRGLISGPNVVKIPTDKALTAALAAATRAEGLHTRMGTVASGDLFVAKPAHKEKIRAEFDAVACEMEGAAIGQVAYAHGVPFAVLRAISDGGDGMEFTQFVRLAAERSIRVTLRFVGDL
ncbi:MAG: 5'-methylthioadenosine/adenosylhomocysteine nucleosidase [Clostridia bacterium]|nr:5'-methylthioadenosine/adenosylhomocysteine nucleosidase [Clostridia bacterium]